MPAFVTRSTTAGLRPRRVASSARSIAIASALTLALALPAPLASASSRPGVRAVTTIRPVSTKIARPAFSRGVYLGSRRPAAQTLHGIPPGGIPRSVLSLIPRRLYDPIGTDGAAQHELLAVAAEISAAASPSAYAGESLDTRAGLVELYLAGPRGLGLGKALRPLSARQRSLVRVHWVPLPARQLARFMSRTSGIAARLRTAGIGVQSWWPDFRDGVIAVTLRQASAAQLRATRRALNGIPVRVTSTASPAPVPASAAAATQDPTCPPQWRR